MVVFFSSTNASRGDLHEVSRRRRGRVDVAGGKRVAHHGGRTDGDVAGVSTPIILLGHLGCRRLDGIRNAVVDDVVQLVGVLNDLPDGDSRGVAKSAQDCPDVLALVCLLTQSG